MIIGIISAFVATVAFSILFHVPKNELLFCGAAGAAGWAVYLISTHFQLSPVTGNFLAALVVSQSSSILAKLRKMPVTVFLVPGIIPLVPGAGTYQTMYALFTKDYTVAIGHATFTFQVAAVIVGGIVFTTILPAIVGKNKSMLK